MKIMHAVQIVLFAGFLLIAATAGAQIQLLQDCYDGYLGSGFQPAYAWAWVDIYIRQIAISFY